MLSPQNFPNLQPTNSVHQEGFIQFLKEYFTDA